MTGDGRRGKGVGLLWEAWDQDVPALLPLLSIFFGKTEKCLALRPCGTGSVPENDDTGICMV